jgi:hypothetical protein
VVWAISIKKMKASNVLPLFHMQHRKRYIRRA